MTPLSPPERRALRAKAHHLDPVVIVGQHGLTPAVMYEIDISLLAHELIKIRVLNDDRAAREQALEQICGALDAAPIQHLGKLLVIWRPAPERAVKPPARDKNKSSTTKRPAQRKSAGAPPKESRSAGSGSKARPRARTLADGKKPAARRVPRAGSTAIPVPAAGARRRRRTTA
jgi:RNA-binding protein